MPDKDTGYIYKVNESEIFVSSRPKRLWQSEDPTLYDPDAYLSVTDSFCTTLKGKIFVWFPWNEGRYPTPEMFYACNKALIAWVHYQKLPKIQVFCDGGTHRSVTVFGAFLLTYYPREAKKIIEARTPVGRENLDKESASYVSDPLEYIEGYIEKFPEDLLFFKVMGDDYLSRLDQYQKDVFDRVTKRHGEDRR